MARITLLASPNGRKILDRLIKEHHVQGQDLVIDYSTESNYYLEHQLDPKDIFTVIHEVLYANNVPTDTVELLTGNVLAQEGYNNFLVYNMHINPLKSVKYSPLWLCQTVDSHTDYSENYIKTAKEKHFSCLNGRNRVHRNTVFDYLTENNLISKGICTYVAKGISVDGYTDPDLINSHTKQQQSFYDVFDNSYYDLITETSVGVSPHEWWTEVFFTEKIWRSIYYKRPFLLVGNHHALKQLHKMGFKTFNGLLFDEHYDNIPDNDSRIQAVLKENKQIVENMSLTELDHIIHSKEMADILQHNYEKINTIATQHSQSVLH
jgi:hypothetical protein